MLIVKGKWKKRHQTQKHVLRQTNLEQSLKWNFGVHWGRLWQSLGKYSLVLFSLLGPYETCTSLTIGLRPCDLVLANEGPEILYNLKVPAQSLVLSLSLPWGPWRPEICEKCIMTTWKEPGFLSSVKAELLRKTSLKASHFWRVKPNLYQLSHWDVGH